MIKVEGVKSVYLQAGKLLIFEMYKDAPSESFEAAEFIMGEINTQSGTMALEDMEIRVVAMDAPSKQGQEMTIATVRETTRYDITVKDIIYTGMYRVGEWEGLAKYANEQTWVIVAHDDAGALLGGARRSLGAKVVMASHDVLVGEDSIKTD